MIAGVKGSGRPGRSFSKVCRSRGTGLGHSIGARIAEYELWRLRRKRTFRVWKPASFWGGGHERLLYSGIPERAAQRSTEARFPMDEEVYLVPANVRGGQDGR
jgi:hypothetical protein